MHTLQLPPGRGGQAEQLPPDVRQLTIIGSNGAGKSRFMEEMVARCGRLAFRVNVLTAFFPGSGDEKMPSTDSLKHIRHRWESLFPGNRIILQDGIVMFATRSGDDLIAASSLSRGEKAALFYLTEVLRAPRDGVIFIDSPTLFLHPALLGPLWNSVEELRPDCMFVYNSVDEDFVQTRTRNASIWIRHYDAERHEWDYRVIGPGNLSEDIFLEFSGTRRTLLFIEGDARNSIDRRLYSLVFPDMNVRPLGSCNKVIETTRTINDQHAIHHLESMGIVDRDRRTDQEVTYLRNKRIMVPDVAEIENLFMLPGVMKMMARHRGRDPHKIHKRVTNEVIRLFKAHSEEQALQHVRHKMKRDVECRIDARFSCITALELHLRGLEKKLQPRRHYNRLREEFAALVRDRDYEGILRVFNHKPMVAASGLPQLLGYHSTDDYISGVLDVLKSDSHESRNLRAIIRHCLHADEVSAVSLRSKTKDNNSNR